MRKSIVLLIILIATRLVTNAQILNDKWVECNPQGCLALDLYFSEGVTLNWDGACVNGKANGFGKLTKYKNGEYESTYEGDYKNGIREGKGKFTHADGSTKTGTFVKGQLVGEGMMIAEDGAKYVGSFINYRQHGLGTFNFPNGDQFVGFFVSDEFYLGKVTLKNGEVVCIQKGKEVDEIIDNNVVYHSKLGVPITEYFDKNFVRCSKENRVYVRQITYQSKNKPTDSVKTYYKNGQLYSKTFVVYLDYNDEGKNFYEGEAIFYFEDGKIKEKIYLLNNKVTGLNTKYYPNGQIFKELNYSNGLKHGSCKEWYENGKPKSIAIYEEGDILQDLNVEYDENGNVK
jgi:uncharacterized protein